MIRTTRRQALAGAAAVAVAPTAAAAQKPPAHVGATAEGVRLGRAIAATPRGGRLVVAHAGVRSVAILDRRSGKTRIVDVGGEPLELAISPDASTAAVTTAWWSEPALVLVDLAAGAVSARIDAGPTPFAVAYAGDRIVVSGGEQDGTLHVVEGGSATAFPLGRVPRGVAATAEHAWVALNGEAALVQVALAGGAVVERIAVAELPDRVAISPDGAELLVTHRAAVSEVTSGRVRTHEPGRLPSDVAYTASGRRLVALGGEGAVAELGGARRPVGPEPRGLTVAGERAWTVSGVTGEIREVGS